MKRLIGSAAMLIIAACVATPASAQEVPDWVNRVKLSGVAFGDYYWFASHHNPNLEGQHGFWMRRIYLTLDVNLEEDWDFRLRLEGNSPGGPLLESAKITPFVKDAWVRWKPSDQSFYLGITGTPTWGVVEKEWGYRDVEKTPLDLMRLGASRDFGVAAKGPIGSSGKFFYHTMVGNGSSTRNETNPGKGFHLALGVEPGSGFLFEVYGAYNDQESNTDLFTGQAFGTWRNDNVRIGVQYAHLEQERQDEDNVKIDLISVYTVWDVSDRVALLARFDKLFDPNPNAPRIDYLRLSDEGKINFLLAGVDLKIIERFHVIPNLETIFYDALDGGEAPKTDVIPRITFSLTF
jgi:hypothetical protein